MRRTPALLLAFLTSLPLILALLVGTAAPASAHATLVSSDPAEGAVLGTTPDVVTFTFDEPVSLTGDAVQVFDAAGEPVDSESSGRDTVITTDLPDALDDGTYVVVWRAVSADGHPIAGSLTFSIGAPSAVVEPPRVPDADDGSVRRVLSVFQGLDYAGLLLASGLVLFLAWTVSGVRVDEAVRERLLRVAWSGAGLAFVAGLATIPLTGAYQQGLGLKQLGESAAVDLDLVGDDLMILGLQVVGLVVALVTVVRGIRPRVAVAAAAVAAVSPAIVGHSRAIEPVWLVSTTDVVHLLAGATWFGGLVGLGLVLRSLSGRERDVAAVLTRFSLLAATSLGLLAVTGSLMGWRVLGGWAPLLDTTYGRLLMIKVGIAVLVAMVAGWNRFRLLPSATSGVGHHARRAAALKVGRAVRVEAGLLVVLLMVTGFLTNQSPRDADPSRAPVPSAVETAVLADDLKVLATMDPLVPGPTTVMLQVQDLGGEPVDGFEAPTFSLRSQTVDLGIQGAVPVGAGTYAVETVIPSAGTWEVQVSLRISEFDNPVATVTFEVTR